MQYETKDSGKRQSYPSGMRRDTAESKPRFDLIPVMPLKRLAELYARGAAKYGDRNWELANSEEELQRFKASGLRHMYQWLNGETDEDHAIAVVFNLFAYLTIEERLRPDAVKQAAFREAKKPLALTITDIREPNINSRYDHEYEACWCNILDGEAHCSFCGEEGDAHGKE